MFRRTHLLLCKKNISIQCSESVDTVGVYKEALQIL